MSTFSAGRAELLDLYKRLKQEYGPSGWWPSEYGGDYEIVCGAILTQRVAWRNVKTALQRMREADIWGIKELHEVPMEQLEEAVKPSGFYRSKARKLKAFAEMVISKYNGDLNQLFALDMLTLRKELLSVWGVGYETADDIVLYCANLPRFVIDAYTVRIIQRLGWDGEASDGTVTNARYTRYQEFFETALGEEVELYQDYHGLLDRHAARVCQTKPLCDVCCLKDICKTYSVQKKR